jgi:hypothetical protein
MLLSRFSTTKQLTYPFTPHVFRRELYGFRLAKCTLPHLSRLTTSAPKRLENLAMKCGVAHLGVTSPFHSLNTVTVDFECNGPDCDKSSSDAKVQNPDNRDRGF